MANSASRRRCLRESRCSPEKCAMIRSRHSRKRSFFSTASIRSSIFVSQRSKTSSGRTAPRRSSVSCSARIPVCATKRFFSRFPTDSKSVLTASPVRLTTSSSVEMRSSRCSSNGISSWASPPSSTTPTPESTSSFEWQREQNSSSSLFLRPQTWQNITVARAPRWACALRAHRRAARPDAGSTARLALAARSLPRREAPPSLPLGRLLAPRAPGPAGDEDAVRLMHEEGLRIRRSPGRTSCRASRRRPSSRGAGSGGTSGRRSPPGEPAGWRGTCPGR